MPHAQAIWLWRGPVWLSAVALEELYAGVTMCGTNFDA